MAAWQQPAAWDDSFKHAGAGEQSPPGHALRGLGNQEPCPYAAPPWTTSVALHDGSPMTETKSETRDGMRIDWDAAIHMDDRVVLRADGVRPTDDGQDPVIANYVPYAKGLAFQEGYKSAWLRMTSAYPETAEGSSNKYQNWELVDPEKWVPDGYAIVRVDSRGAGRSPGYLEVWSPREAKDRYGCVAWD